MMMIPYPFVPNPSPALTKAYLHHPGAAARARLPGFHTCVGGGGERHTPEKYQELGVTVLLNTKVRSYLIIFF